MNNIDLTIAAIRRQDPTISEAEARQMAEAQYAPESRTDGAPSAPLTPDVQLDYPDQRYRYNPASRTWDDVYEEAASRSAEQDRQAQAGAHGYRWGGKVPHASDEAAADYSTRPANGPSQQDLDMLQTGEYNRSGTGWVEYYDPKTGATVLGRRAPAPPVTVEQPQIGSDQFGNRFVIRPGGVMVGGVPMRDAPGYRPPEDTPGANLAAGYAGATGFRDWTVDGGIPEYAQGYDWGGPEEGWANEATGGGRIGRGVSNRDVQREMPQTLESPSGRSAYDRVPVLRESPNGPVWVYDYDPADEEGKKTRAENAQGQKDELQLRRMAEKAGISMAKARSLKESGGVPGDAMRGIRDLILDRRREDKEARRKAYTDRNMLAGNDPRQNLVNAYNTLSPEMQQQAMLGMMFPDGATPLDVQQARAMAEARLSANAAGATNINNPLVAQQVEASQQEKREAMLRDAEAYVTNTWADQQGWSNYLNRLAVGIGIPVHDNTLFTVAEQQATVEYLMQKYNITEQEARAIVDTIAATRTTEAPASTQTPPQNPSPQRPPNGWR